MLTQLIFGPQQKGLDHLHDLYIEKKTYNKLYFNHLKTESMISCY